MEKEKEQINRINQDALVRPWMNKAEELTRKHDLLKRLNIVQPEDSKLFLLHFAIRLIRAHNYDVTKLLSPYSFQTVRANLLRSQFGHAALVYEKTSNETLLDHLDVSNREFIEEHYSSLQQKNKARTVELAVNNLCAQALVFDEIRVKSEFKPSRKILKAWTETWKDKIMQYNNPVRKA